MNINSILKDIKSIELSSQIPLAWWTPERVHQVEKLVVDIDLLIKSFPENLQRNHLIELHEFLRILQHLYKMHDKNLRSQIEMVSAKYHIANVKELDIWIDKACSEILRKMPENPEQERVDAFFQSFNGKYLETSEGKKVKIILGHSKSKFAGDLSDSQNRLFEFEGYPGESKDKIKPALTVLQRLGLAAKPKIEIVENYVKFRVDFERKRITMDAFLESPELRGKNVFPQIIREISKTFPKGFALVSEIVNDKIQKQLLEIQWRLRRGELTQTEAESEVSQKYFIKGWIKSGFNDIRVSFDESMMGENVFFYCSKTADAATNVRVEFNVKK
jgi:hypothetical protein